MFKYKLNMSDLLRLPFENCRAAALSMGSLHALPLDGVSAKISFKTACQVCPNGARSCLMTALIRVHDQDRGAR
jgi:hypothetical protein